MPTITNKKTNEVYVLSRDVRDNHPQWIHEQLETDGLESNLQHMLDQLDISSFFSGEYSQYMGEDSLGIGLTEEEINEYQKNGS